MGNRTFIIMLSACLVQVLVVGGTVTYVALSDSGAAEVAEAESALASEDHQEAYADDVAYDSGEGPHAYQDESDDDGGYGNESPIPPEPTGDPAATEPSQPADGHSGGAYY